MKYPAAAEPEDRIAALELRVRNMDALIRGLIEEALDFKAMAMTMSRQAGERSRQELTRGPVVQDTASPVPAGPSASPSVAADPEARTIIRPRAEPSPAAPAEPDMVRIMQADGTMKMEPRSGGRTIDSAKGDGSMKRSTALRGRLAPRSPGSR